MKRLFLLISFLTAFHGYGQTGCIENLPFSENFDGSSWVPNTSFTTIGSIPSCWLRVNTAGDYLWMAGPTFWNNGNSGPAADHTTGNGQFAVATPIFTNNNKVATQLITPPVDLSTATNPRLVFYYHMYGNAIDKLDVRARKIGTSNWVVMGSINYNSSDFTSSTSPWKLGTFDIPSSLIGDTVQVRFAAVRTSSASTWTNSEIAIDDILIEESPSCEAPLNIVASAVASSSATINWSGQNTSPASYQIRYKASSTSSSGGTIISTTSKPHTINGLNSNTTYAVSVRTICTIGDTSAWSLDGFFTTTCSEVTAPWSEDFDGSTFVPSTIWSQQGTIDACWGVQGGQYQFWSPGPFSFNWNLTGPNADHTTGSSTGKWMTATFVSTFNPSVNPRLFTPWIDLDTLSNPQLSFWYHAFGNQMGDMEVKIRSKQQGWTSVWDTTGQLQGSKTALWKEKVIDLSSYVGDTIRIWFDYTDATGNQSQWGLDDVTVGPAPSCPNPSNVSVLAAGVMAAQLQWSSGGATSFDVRYRTKGSSSWSTTTASAAAFTLGGLNPQTTYEWAVRDNCGGGDVSSWIPGPDFTTLCNIVTAPFSESFTSSDWSSPQWPNQSGVVSECWARTDTTDYFFTVGSSSFFHYNGTGPSGDHTTGSGKYIFTRSGSPFTTTANTSIRLPLINLDTLQSPQMTFWYHMYGADIDKLLVFGRKLGATSNVLLKTINTTVNSSTANWTKATVPLTQFEGDTMVLRFVAYRSGSGFTAFRAAIAIDDIVIDETNNCPPPAAAVNSITYNSAALTWNGLSNNSNVELGLQGFTPGTGTSYNNVQSPLNLSGLLPNTTYTVYVQDSCTSSLLSTWDSVSFTTPACPAITALGSVTLNGSTVSAYSNSTDADSIIWYWGDGTQDIDSAASHTYNGYGSFTVNQVVYNACGSSDTLQYVMNLCAPLSLQLNANTTALLVELDTLGTVGTGLTFGGDYGDGTSVSNTTLLNGYTYANAGTYDITLWAQDLCGNSDTTVIGIQVCDSLTPSFTYSAVGNTFSFSAQPAGMSTYSWDFGDGSSGIGENVSHGFASNGTFTVTLTVVNACGESYSYFEEIATCEQPGGDFSFIVLSTGSGGMVVQFQSNTSNTTSYTWSFGDGQQVTGTNGSVQHTYAVVTLNYYVTLTLTNDCGDTYTITKSLTELGLEDWEGVGALYPNPASERIQWDFQSAFTGEIEVLNSEGRILQKEHLESALSHVIDVSKLPAGTYWVQMHNSLGTVVRAFVVQ